MSSRPAKGRAVRFPRLPIALEAEYPDTTGASCLYALYDTVVPSGFKRCPAGVPPPADEGGRGLFLVAQITHRWGSRYDTSGKTIWTEQLRPTIDPAPPQPAPGRPHGR